MFKKLQILQVKFMRFRRLHRKRKINALKLMARHPLVVPIVTIMLLGGITGVTYYLASHTHHLPRSYNARIVIISHDHERQIVPSKESTVGQLLKKLNITLAQGDVVEPAQTARINQDQFRINIYRAVPVEIVDGNMHTYTFSASKTPRAIAQQAGTNLYPEDDTSRTPTNDFVKDGAIGQQVIVDRAVPVSVDLYGTPVVLRTHAKTVADFIKEKNIKLVKNDQIVPAPTTPIVPGQPVAFIRTGTKVETNTETIAMPVQKINDPSLAYGTSAVRQQGTDGQQVVTYQVALTNNVETGRTVIQKVVSKQPVTQIEVIGTSLSGIKGDMALAGIAPSDYEYVDYIVSHESGWRPFASNGSGAYGLCQALPGSKMASAGADWETNPITQLRWCASYANRYGGWAGSYNHWINSRNW